MEEFVPIKIKHLYVHQPHSIVEREDVTYYNIVVRDCPQYVQDPLDPDHYIRQGTIKRLEHVDNATMWPDHPLTIDGENMGAIVLIESSDNKYLFVKNGRLWGLPKGARNFIKFLELQDQCNSIYLERGEIPIFSEETIFDEIETPEENIIRETREETGIIMNHDGLVRYNSNSNSNCAYTRFCYKLDLSSTDYTEILEMNGTDHENDEIIWKTGDEIRKLLAKHNDKPDARVFNRITYKYLTSYFNQRKMNKRLN